MTNLFSLHDTFLGGSFIINVKVGKNISTFAIYATMPHNFLQSRPPIWMKILPYAIFYEQIRKPKVPLEILSRYSCVHEHWKMWKNSGEGCAKECHYVSHLPFIFLVNMQKCVKQLVTASPTPNTHTEKKKRINLTFQLKFRRNM